MNENEAIVQTAEETAEQVNEPAVQSAEEPAVQAEEQTTSAAEEPSVEHKKSKKPLVIFCVILALLLGGYLAFCAWVEHSEAIWDETYVLGEDLGGMTVEQAAAHLEDLPLLVNVFLEGEEAPAAVLTAEELGITIDARGMARVAEHRRHVFQNEVLTFLTAGWRYFFEGPQYETFGAELLVMDDAALQQTVQTVADKLSYPAEDAAYELTETAIRFTAGKDGRQVSAAALKQLLLLGDWQKDLTVTIPCETLPAKGLTAQEIHDELAGDMVNAAYDSETDTITADSIGVSFDVAAAQQKMDAAAAGETVNLVARVEFPAVTAAELEAVLFRDVLGECKTHVSGTAARISNVKLSAATINGLVLNAGDVFSYNESVGKRTAANGYKPAPAYIRGETVDEIGGGICQTSSTLYLACLRGDLEITERYAHRYVPAYIPWGMDATVSWGGPDYKFTNNTNYPVKIVTEYEKGYLTVKLLGTNVDGRYAKVTNEVLSTTPWTTVYEEDPTMAPGTPETEKTSPYTGYKVRTYHTIYDKDGSVIDSHYEATSDYKVRNKVILRPPAAVTEPAVPAVGGGETVVTPPAETVTPQETPPETAEDVTAETPAEPAEGTEVPAGVETVTPEGAW